MTTELQNSKYSLDNYFDNNIYKLGFALLDQNPTVEKEKDYEPTFEPTKETLLKRLDIIKKFSDCRGATFTLKPKWHDEDPKTIHRYIHEKIAKSRLWRKEHYMLFPEFTKKGVVHYHAIFWDIYQAPYINLIQWWRRTFGFAKVELKINHINAYIRYMTKDYGNVGLYTIYQIDDK